jgi:hypothetical protein
MSVPTRTVRRIRQEPGGPKLVDLRSVVVAIIVTAILTMIASVTFSVILIGQPQDGGQGPPGPAGPRGPAGPQGVAKVDSSTVWKALAADPQRLARFVNKGSASGDQPDLLKVQDDVATVASDLQDLCSQLQSASALSDAGLTCPTP